MPLEDLSYVPQFTDYNFSLANNQAMVLIVGPLPDQVSNLGAYFTNEIRNIQISPTEIRALHQGLYAGTSDSYPFLLIWNGGPSPSNARTASERSTENHDPLFIAKEIHKEFWERSQPLNAANKFSVNEPVSIVGATGAEARGVIQEIHPYPEGIRYRVLVGGRIVNKTESGIAKFQGRTDDPASWLAESPSGHRSIATTLTSIKMRHPLTDMIYSFSTSKTLFRAYQFKPVLKILSNERSRLLIADEVGLGKTIEAGLIWTELEQRNNLRRVLVVVPANLRDKWQTELRRRFDRDVQILKREDLSKFLDDLDVGLDPDLIGIIGIETMRTYPRLDELATKWPRLDLVIIDEAHSLRNSGTKTSALGSLLSDIADSMVFLSATPINLRTKDLFNLLNMLDEGEFPDFVEFEEQLKPTQVLNYAASKLLSKETTGNSEVVEYLKSMTDMTYGQFIMEHPDFDDVISLLESGKGLDPTTVAKIRRKLANLSPLSSLLTRTRKVDVPGDKAVREPRNIQVPWTPLESEYYKTLQDTLTAEVLAKGGIPGFELQMPLRQAASCLPASIALMKNKRGVDDELIDDYDDTNYGQMAGTITVAPVLEKILATWDLSKEVDTKYDQLLHALDHLPSSREHKNRQETPVLLFSFFRPTLEYLQRRLTHDGKRVGLMYGKTPMDDRKKIMKDFRDGKFDVLLVSEVGSEGLDFEFCNVLVNYDLPWNPMRVEQRIGRLDRFGQKSDKIFIFNLEIPETIEGQIIGRLYDRIDIFRLALGDLEPILGEVDSLLRMTLDPSLSADQKKQRQEEIMVAIEARLMDLGDLEENRGNLLGLDSAAIEGFTDSTPGAGKYIGELELKNFLEYGLSHYQSKLKQGSIPGTYKLEGTQALADDLMRHREFKEGTSLGRDRLIQLCRDGEWIELTFTSDLASREDTEMMSIRHPIARVVELAMRSGLALERFGAVSLAEIDSSDTYLMAVNLASATGTRPMLELWPVVVRLSDFTVVEGLGDLALQALSDGRLGEWTGAHPAMEQLEAALRIADDNLFSRQQFEERRAQAANMALVSTRQKNIERQISRKIEVATRRVEEVTDEKIQKMTRAQILNLERDRNDKVAELETQKSLSMSVEQLAFVLIQGSAN